MYDRKTLMWQPRPTTDLPGVAKTWTFETSVDTAGPWNPAPVVGIASRNSRCSEFTDITKLPGVPGKDGDCLLITYRMVDYDQYVRATAVALDGTKSVPSGVLYLPEPALGIMFWVLVVFLMMAVAGDERG